MTSNIPQIPRYEYSHVFWWDRSWDRYGGEKRRKFFQDLHRTKICPFCKIKMIKVKEISGKCTRSDYVVICNICGFWFGRGYKELMGPCGLRGAVGLINYQSLDSIEITTEELIRFLNENPKWLPNVNPFKAEELVCQLLRDAFGWEVKYLGGRKDGGVDALAVLSNAGKAIIQVKWRLDTNRAESVSVVRELAGTLIARGVPHGILVTTRRDLSGEAKKEANLVSSRSVKEIGRLNIEWKNYSNILAMLEISAQRIDSPKRVPFPWPNDTFHIFDGGGIWDANWKHLASSYDLEKSDYAIDPYSVLDGFR